MINYKEIRLSDLTIDELNSFKNSLLTKEEKTEVFYIRKL